MKRNLTVAEVAFELVVSTNTVRNWIKNGKLRAINVSGSDDSRYKSYVIPVEAYEEFKQKYSTSAPSARSND